MIWRYHCLIFQGSPPKCFLSGGYILFRFLFLFTFWFLLLSFLCNIGRFPYSIKFVVGFIFHPNSHFWWSCSWLSPILCCLCVFFLLDVKFVRFKLKKWRVLLLLKTKKNKICKEWTKFDGGTGRWFKIKEPEILVELEFAACMHACFVEMAIKDIVSAVVSRRLLLVCLPIYSTVSVLL